MSPESPPSFNSGRDIPLHCEQTYIRLVISETWNPYRRSLTIDVVYDLDLAARQVHHPSKHRTRETLSLDMNWFEIVGVLGFGAVLDKLIDIFWKDRIRHEREHRKWLRDARLSAYADLTKYLLSFGVSRGAQQDNPFQWYVIASRALLLADDEDLIAKIDVFLVDLEHHAQLLKEENYAEAEALYSRLWDRARGIVGDLRTSLVQK